VGGFHSKRINGIIRLNVFNAPAKGIIDWWEKNKLNSEVKEMR